MIKPDKKNELIKARWIMAGFIVLIIIALLLISTSLVDAILNLNGNEKLSFYEQISFSILVILLLCFTIAYKWKAFKWSRDIIKKHKKTKKEALSRILEDNDDE